MSERTTRFFFYCGVLLVAGSSVLFGLDWQSAPMSPMAPIKLVAIPPPPAAPSPPAPANPAAINPVSIAPVAPQPVAPALPAPQPVAAAPPQPKCDVEACAAAYRTFRESDCTYIPSFGERRLCTKGVVPTAAAPDGLPTIANPEPDAGAPGNPPGAAQCNVSACAAAYHSFTASDCTYQPNFGPRRLCAK